MKNKICSIFIVASMILTCFWFQAAFAQEASPFAEFNKNADKGAVYVSVKRGSGADQLGRVIEDKTAETLLMGPSAFCADGAGNLYFADCVNFRVVKYDASNKKASAVFDYKMSAIKNGFVSDIAVAKSGDVYLVNSAENYVYRFDQSGKPLAVIGQIEDRHVAKRIAAIFCDPSSNLVVIDAQNPNAIVFSPEGKIIKESEFKFEDATSYALDNSGKPFAARLDGDSAKLVDLETGKETVLKYEIDRAKENKLVEARLVGFDNAGAAYVKMTVIDKNGGMVNNAVVKFKGAAVEKSVKLPYLTIDERELNLKAPEILLKDNTVLGYFDSDASFDVIAYEVK
ncbi:MAG TPA: hypothetical protein PK467_04630 [Candidatus Wallbacteria bacterium]|nr:hypothetical protein [Candidatus Wallbacteria bacterium]